MREHRIAEWFNRGPAGRYRDGRAAEREFFAARGLAFNERELLLRPGDLLVLDNLRVAHGRSGRRGAGELWQFLYGVEAAAPAAVGRFRSALAKELCAPLFMSETVE